MMDYPHSKTKYILKPGKESPSSFPGRRFLPARGARSRRGSGGRYDGFVTPARAKEDYWVSLNRRLWKWTPKKRPTAPFLKNGYFEVKVRGIFPRKAVPCPAISPGVFLRGFCWNLEPRLLEPRFLALNFFR